MVSRKNAAEVPRTGVPCYIQATSMVHSPNDPQTETIATAGHTFEKGQLRHFHPSVFAATSGSLSPFQYSRWSCSLFSTHSSSYSNRSSYSGLLTSCNSYLDHPSIISTGQHSKLQHKEKSHHGRMRWQGPYILLKAFRELWAAHSAT